MEVKVSDETLRDVLVCALEGGSNYWYQIVNYQFPLGVTYQDFREGGKFTDPNNYFHPIELIPFQDGCGIFIKDVEAPDSEAVLVDKALLQKGLQLMSEKYPKQFANVLSEDFDSETGDVLLQLSMFGEIVFG